MLKWDWGLPDGQKAFPGLRGEGSARGQNEKGLTLHTVGGTELVHREGFLLTGWVRRTEMRMGK